jgi:hypothetical protein
MLSALDRACGHSEAQFPSPSATALNQYTKTSRITVTSKGNSELRSLPGRGDAPFMNASA